MLSPAISLIQSGFDLSEQQAEESISAILTHTLPEEEIFTFLQALKQKGESISEIVGGALALRAAMTRIDLPQPLTDVCGTGGSQKARFNVSTASAFLVASLGVPVAKHGNFGSKSANGSFDFLTALHIPFGQSPSEIQAQFSQYPLCFLLARTYHPAVAKAAAARKRINGPTLFNFIGPLCNPASPSHQVIGTPNPANAKKLAQATQELGTTSTLIISGHEGRDELSLTHTSSLIQVTPTHITESIFDPKILNLPPIHEAQLETESAQTAATLFLDLLHRKNTTHPIVHWIALNTGAALTNFGIVSTILEGYKMALIAWKEKRINLNLFREQ